jgi:predicted O-linked N-acetylglucosamine transferase (SPINDLY family)
MSDKEIALLSRSLEIDIAVDLAGYTKGNRTGVFAMSAAPIQLVYLGFLGTMGSSYYDYIISDPMMIPEDNKDYYTENIVYLPSYQVNSNQVTPIDSSFDRHYFGLPEDAFVFCCFNNTFKLTPAVFDSWARILTQVADSVLMLYVVNDRAINNIKNEMNNRGIDPTRLIFSGRLGGSKYWSRYQVVDLFLDTFICSGGATLSDALRVGCPVLTYMGNSASSRFGGSILTSLGLPELVMTKAGEYEELAVHLATHPEELKTLKEKLVANIATERLYDTQRFTHSIEAAYSQMHNRSQKGLGSKDIYIDQTLALEILRNISVDALPHKSTG